jgi:hypothetical protein
MIKWVVYEDKISSGRGLAKHGSYFISKGILINSQLRVIKHISRLKELRELPTVFRSNALIHAVIPDPKTLNRSCTITHALNRLTRQIDKTRLRRK